MLELTPDGWCVAVVADNDATQVLRCFYQAEGVLSVGAELAPRPRRQLLH